MRKILSISADITLRELSIDDAPVIFNAINDNRKYLCKWLPFVDYTASVDDTASFIDTVLNDGGEKFRQLVFTIIYKGEFVGLIGLKDVDWSNLKLEIGYWLVESFQKFGIVTRSVDFLCNYAFEELGFNRIVIKCAVGNESSSRVPKRLRFKFEGIERDGEKMSNDLYASIEVYSLLARDNINTF